MSGLALALVLFPVLVLVLVLAAQCPSITTQILRPALSYLTHPTDTTMTIYSHHNLTWVSHEVALELLLQLLPWLLVWLDKDLPDSKVGATEVTLKCRRPT